jgi:ADP-heptose:LPS heptosyltransferase
MSGERLHVAGRPPRRIGVFRALQLGDLLCAVPALRALRHAFPDASVTLIGLPWASAFARRFRHVVDGFIAFPGHHALPERAPEPAAWPRFIREVRKARFDVVLQMHGSGAVTNAIVREAGAALTAGFHPAHERCPDASLFCRWPDEGTEVERCLALTDFLGLPRRGTQLEFPVFADEEALAESLCRTHGLSASRFVCVHPGARLATRRWPVERFAALARELAGAGHRVVVTGTADEAALCAHVARAAGPGAVDLCDRTSLGVLAALAARARLVVCNDTGMSHVAAAVGTRSVVVSCGADPMRFAPADSARHRVLAHMTPCRPCMHKQCPTAHECATGVSLDAVVHAVFTMLGGVPRRVRAAA